MWAGTAMIASVLVPGAVANVMIGLKTDFPEITTYTPKSSVYQHSYIDKDQAKFMDLLAEKKFDEAKTLYQQGHNSVKSVTLTVASAASQPAVGAIVKQGAVEGILSEASGTAWTVKYESDCIQGVDATCFEASATPLTWSTAGSVVVTAATNKFRTLAGFSTAAESKMTGEVYFDMYKEYYKKGDYADFEVVKALNDENINDAARQQIAKKTSAYMNVWMYVIHEMEGAIKDCKDKKYDAAVHSWDEAVAFYSGSMEGTKGEGAGKLLHGLAEKRCKNYKTCDDDKTNVNKLVLGKFKEGQTKLSEGKCDEIMPMKKSIVELMSVPLLQGALRYAAKVDNMEEANRKAAYKERAEGHVFMKAILPRINSCKADAADLFNKNLDLKADKPMADGLATVRSAVESTYKCLGISCAMVGGLEKDASQDGFTACVDADDSGASTLGHIGRWAVFCWALAVYQLAT